MKMKRDNGNSPQLRKGAKGKLKKRRRKKQDDQEVGKVAKIL